MSGFGFDRHAVGLAVQQLKTALDVVQCNMCMVLVIAAGLGDGGRVKAYAVIVHADVHGVLLLPDADAHPAAVTLRLESVYDTVFYQRLNGQDLITTPKTEKSNRVITMPQFLAEEIQDYIKMLYGIGPDDRMFTITKSYLHREMDRGAKEAGIPRIRIHDIRHSAVSLLIDMGFSATAIADRVGHESIDITYRYAHLFPTKQTEMADKLNQERSIEHDGKSA